MAMPLLAATACSDKELAGDLRLDLQPKLITVTTNSVNFGANDNLTATLPVKAQNMSWNLGGEPSWLTISPKQGTQSADVALTAQENTSVDEARVGVLNLSASEFSYDRQIAVSQQQAAIVLTPSTTSLSVKAAATTQTIAVTANVEWNVTCSDTWLTAKRSGSSLCVAISENLGASRSTTIHLKRTGTDATLATIQVVQGEAGVTGSTEQLTFDVSGEEKTYTFEADASWTATTSDASWLTVSPTGGSNSVKSLKITALPNISLNERSGFVYIKIADATKLEIPIRQSAVEMTADVTSLSFPSTAETRQLTFQSNVNWQIISAPSWISVSPASGPTGTSTITIQCEQNTNTSARSGIVSFAVLDGKNAFFNVNINQEGQHIEGVTGTVNLSSYSQKLSIDVTASGYWKSSTDAPDWIHISPAESTGNGTIVVNIDENLSESSRVGKVIINEVGVLLQEITINQAGKLITVDCTGVISSANACSVALSINAGVNWIADTDADWLSLSAMQGSGATDMIVNVAYNPSINQREGNVIFHYDDNRIFKYSLSQPGRTLSCNTDMIKFGGKGGESQEIIVFTQGDFAVTPNSSWITAIKQPGANTFKISVPELLQMETRSGEVEIELIGTPSGEQTLNQVIRITQSSQGLNLGDFGDEEKWD